PEGNWVEDIVQTVVGRKQYLDLYLQAVNERNIAATLLADAKRFQQGNDPGNASKYARLAEDWLNASDTAFSLCDDVYYGVLTDVQDALYIPHEIGMSALSVL